MMAAHQGANTESAWSMNPASEYGSTGSPRYQPSAMASDPNAWKPNATNSTGAHAISTMPRPRPTSNSVLEMGRESSTSAIRSRSSRALMSKARKMRPSRKITMT